MTISTTQRRHSASAFTSNSNLNVSLNIGIAYIQRWRARQLIRVGYLYRALPGASSWLTANSREQRLSWFCAALHKGRPSLTLSVLGEHATGGANPRRSSNGWSVQQPASETPLMRHSVKTPNVEVRGGRSA